MRVVFGNEDKRNYACCQRIEPIARVFRDSLQDLCSGNTMLVVSYMCPYLMSRSAMTFNSHGLKLERNHTQTCKDLIDLPSSGDTLSPIILTLKIEFFGELD